jgi:hypothetical protein
LSASAVVVSQLRLRSNSVVPGYPVRGQFRTLGPPDANRTPIRTLSDSRPSLQRLGAVGRLPHVFHQP